MFPVGATQMALDFGCERFISTVGGAAAAWPRAALGAAARANTAGPPEAYRSSVLKAATRVFGACDIRGHERREFFAAHRQGGNAHLDSAIADSFDAVAWVIASSIRRSRPLEFRFARIFPPKA